MHPATRLAALALLCAGLLAAPRPAQAETYQTCAGFIDSLPATITTQGVWCLRRDLSTAMTSGAAITIATNNVTIDCNDFKVGGLAAGNGTEATGILASERQNATVRHCNVRGFLQGTDLSGDGHAVLESRFDNNTFTGIRIRGDGSVVRGNRVSDTGGSTQPAFPHPVGIRFSSSYAGLVVDNFVQGIYASPGTAGWAHGIRVGFTTGEVARNFVGLLQPDGAGQARGIFVGPEASRVMVRDNAIGSGSTYTSGIGVDCSDGGIARDNVVSGITIGMDACVDAGGNFSN